MKGKILLVLLLISCIHLAKALSISVEGDCIVGHKLLIKTDEPALIILRMNGGTPIYANTSAYFTPQVTGKLRIEAVARNERAFKVVEIKKPSGGGGGYVGHYYLPEGNVTVTLENGGTASVSYRTALGALLRASEVMGFGVRVKAWSYGLFVDCIRGICTGHLGKSSGWMYSVNGEIPMVSADRYNLKAGDDVIWYFSRSMSETPESSPYRIEIKTYPDWSFDVHMHWSITHVSGGGGSTQVSGGEVKRTEEKAVNVTTTKETLKAIVNGTATFVVNVTRVPLKVAVKTAKLVELEFERKALAGMELNKLYATVLDYFSIKANRSVKLTLSFALSKDTLRRLNSSPKDVFLAELKGTWIQIPISYSENETHYLFRANLTNFSSFVIAVKWRGFPLNATDERIVRALNYLKTLQKDDGGFGNPNENSSFSATCWAVMALVSAGIDPHGWKKNGKSPIDYLRDHIVEEYPKMGTADLARTILALVYSGENPWNFSGIDLVSALKDRTKKDGQIGDYIYTTIWGIIALKACGKNVSKSVEWLASHQNPDGGFAWAVGEKSDYDDTAAAIQALIAGGIPRDSEVIKKALEFLKTGQNEDGGMRYFGNSASNSASDSWTIQALVAAGINPKEWKKNGVSVVDHLLSLQTDEGYFKYTKFVTDNPGYMTVSAIMALLGKPHPIKVTKEHKEKAHEIIKPLITPKPSPTQTPTPKPTSIPTPTPTVTPPSTQPFGIDGFTALIALAGITIALAVRRWR